MRDYQKNRVYRWEREIVKPKDTILLTSYDTAQNIVDYMWNNVGIFGNPPIVVPKTTTSRFSTGARDMLHMKPNHLFTWILIHEMAHAWDNTMDENGVMYSSGHGPEYVARYVYLLDKFLKISNLYLQYTLKEHKVDIDTKILYYLMNKYGVI